MLALTELGTRLKEARETKNLSLDDLQQITKIQKRYLIGIEEGNYSVMPGKFYVRAFIKQYAEAVGLDPETIFEEYKSEIPGTYNEELPEQISRVRSRRQISTAGSKVIDKIPMILLIVFVLGSLMTIYWFVSNREVADEPDTQLENEKTQYEASDEPPPTPEDKEEPAEEDDAVEGVTDEEPVEETPVQELVEVEKGKTAATYELKNTDKFKVKVTAAETGQAWVAIQNKQNERFVYKTMANGASEELDLSNQAEVIFNIGRSSDLQIEINGQPFEYPFSTAEVVQQIITIKFTPGTAE
ncbi:RodZ domain-containing protein [Fredinandcohnia sp. 179-A 10B2 NHS]|uniref:helix-turn-helix domain-containing protein n=1 Tax=Fredinandcohnia sp. 179-A 10B2 NHS TaxID=3235176 RepID=UPI0039A28D45